MYIYIYMIYIYIIHCNIYVCTRTRMSARVNVYLLKKQDKIYRYRGVRISFLKKLCTFCMHDHSCTRNVDILTSMYTTYIHFCTHYNFLRSALFFFFCFDSTLEGKWLYKKKEGGWWEKSLKKKKKEI